MLDANRAAFERWRGTGMAERASLYGRLAGTLRERSEPLARLATCEMGKTIGEARAEVEKCAATIAWIGENGPAILADEPVQTDTEDRAHVSFLPIGTVLGVMPWNFAYWQAIRAAGPIMLSGNGFVLKHAPNVMGCADALRDAIEASGFPPHLFAVLNAGNDAVAAAIEDPRIAAVTVTGSMRAGSAIAAIVGRALKKSLLELGAPPARRNNNEHVRLWANLMDKRGIIQSIDFGSDVAEHEAKNLARYFVETDQWARIFNGQIDVIYGAKGSGKSAIYHLMMNKEGEFYDRDILLVPAENPDEDPAFSEIRSELPPTEDEFRSLWRLYLCSVAAVRARDAGVKNQQLQEVLEHLADLNLVERDVSLNTIIRNITSYVAKFFRPSQFSATSHFDPTSGMFVGVTGKISFSEPSPDARRAGVKPIREVLAKLNEALTISGQTIWLLLDRLDVAFVGSEELETRALRALFDAYNGMSGLDRIRPKLFVRTDIWDRMVESGFREATHASSPNRSTTLRWDNTLLFNIFMKRLLQSEYLCQEFAIDVSLTLRDVLLQERLIDRIFPEKIDTGKNPKTFPWVCGRLQDGKNETMPRELIQFCSALRAEQLQRLEKSDAPPTDEILFERASFKAALIPISKNRLLKTIYAESPVTKPWLIALRGRKSLQSIETLTAIWQVKSTECRLRADHLVAIGVFRDLNTLEQKLYEIPLLYRRGLEIVRGAEVGLREDVRNNVDTDADEVDVDLLL